MIQQISEEQYRLLINNRTLFKNIKHIKKEKNKIYADCKIKLNT